MSEDEGFVLTKSGVLTVLGITSSTWETLKNFATSPLRFLRARLIPTVIGAIFGFVFNLAEIVAAPFESVQTGLGTLASALSGAMGSISGPIAGAISGIEGWLLTVTAPLGPLQPFVVTAVLLVLLYVLLVLMTRIARAIMDSIPVVSGIETLLFG
jgi:hypothetical protein